MSGRMVFGEAVEIDRRRADVRRRLAENALEEAERLAITHGGDTTSGIVLDGGAQSLIPSHPSLFPAAPTDADGRQPVRAPVSREGIEERVRGCVVPVAR